MQRNEKIEMQEQAKTDLGVHLCITSPASRTGLRRFCFQQNIAYDFEPITKATLVAF